MSLNRSNFGRELVPGLNALFGLEYGTVEQQHLPLFTVENSERAFEEEVLVTGFGTAPTKAEGAGVTYDSAQEAWSARYTHETIALAFAITEEALEDNLYDTFSKLRTKELARAMANTKQVKAANVFNNGFSASFLGGDGVALFSGSHPTVAAGNQSNTVSADLSETALENAVINIGLFKNDRGILIGARAKSLHIPPQSIFIAERILKSPARSGTADNDVNALKSMSSIPGGCFVNHRFTDTNAWYIRTDINNGTKMFNRVGLSTKMEGDFDSGNMRYKARERYSFGWSDWRGWYGSNGSS
jgi:hypothetical protein